MENNDFCYILMSSLKQPYREHMTKESTSLLMKELDQAASSVVHHIGRGHQQSNTDAGSSAFANNHRHHSNHQRRWDGLAFGSPKSPENVARTILRAFGASNDERSTAASLAGQPNSNSAVAPAATRANGRRRSTSSVSGSNSQTVAVVNGNGHQHQHQHYQKHTSRFQLQHQNSQPIVSSSSVLSRCRRKLHLRLNRLEDSEAGTTPSPLDRRQTENQSKLKRPLSLARPVVLATNGDGVHQQDNPSSFSASDEGATPSSLPLEPQNFVTWPSRRTANRTLTNSPPHAFHSVGNGRRRSTVVHTASAPPTGLEEHQLIAYNSSLLMVKPKGEGGDSESAGGSSEASPIETFPPPPDDATKEQETAILDSADTPPPSHHHYGRHKFDKTHRFFERRETMGGISAATGHVLLSSVEHHPPPSSYSQQHLARQEKPGQDTVTPSGTISSTEPEPSPEPSQQTGGVGLTAAAASADSRSIAGSSLQRIHNRVCTSYRLTIPPMKNPVDVCLLPNDDVAIADYDNGLVIVNDLGEVVEHKKTYREVNACGVACLRGGSSSPAFRIFLLVVRDGVWTINVYRNLELVEMARCPTDAQIENWALRRLVVCVDTRLHLMASGETKSTIWTYEFDKGEWKTMLTEYSGGRKATSGNYNDMSVRYNKDTKETRIVLCEWKKAQLWTLFLNEKTDVIEEKSIKMKRVKGQEWIVQGPHLAVLDDHADILVYDGSGKLFQFDGDTYRCKKIIADLGRGEVSSLAVADGWIYALCRYRRCIDAFMYREQSESNI